MATGAVDPTTGAPAAVAGTGVNAWPDAVLAPYPHIASCPACRRYAVEWNGFGTGIELVTAALAYHDSSHTFDPLTAASQHFASPS